MGDRTGGHTGPTKIGLEDVAAAVGACDYRFLHGSERLLLPWETHRVFVYIGRIDAPVLIAEGELRRTLDLSDINALAHSITDWNMKRINPTVMLSITDDGEVSVRFRTSLPIGAGATDEQLRTFIRTAMQSTELAVDHMLTEFAHLKPVEQTPSPRDALDTDALHGELRFRSAPEGSTHHGKEGTATMSEQEDRDDDRDISDGVNSDAGGDPDLPSPDSPVPVDLARLESTLSDLGIRGMHRGASWLATKVNSILIGFHLDNGPSLILRGMWDPNLDPDRDFMRIFLCCNTWNEKSALTKAYCHTDDDGLQVRVEMSIPTAAGLTSTQLRHTLSLGLRRILLAIGSISEDVTGVSVVEWPED
ncbi:YbjN domain-containing protein [Corynebacterium sp. CCM 9185]|uniref:YbjN domain-containing protein n=1 Tax=Corynebacterium marambiense TaxID=2765364 RepID=A0ABS0VZH5_9CORY|nr:YbjN domain-containing protein [Corynebacterium marambiense]MBI9000813.1 YbjN domain-containing protein [Corynebacterium marambiense]MCK7662921.1 YbjN domain-containing protein [Corynebacterium marambiense]MCX7542530.1 YbjN domain-containing protein [Corynebacterium marambiense]